MIEECTEVYGEYCMRCGKWIGYLTVHNIHHFKKRSAGGGDEVENLRVLCYNFYGEYGCHQWAEANPLAAREEGWSA